MQETFPFLLACEMKMVMNKNVVATLCWRGEDDDDYGDEFMAK